MTPLVSPGEVDRKALLQRQALLSRVPEESRLAASVLLREAVEEALREGLADVEDHARSRLFEEASRESGAVLRPFAQAVREEPALLQAAVRWALAWRGLLPGEGGERALTPTPEQEAAVRAFLSGEDMKVVAVAGSGKTTTLRLMAEAARGERILYVAFNRSVREEARVRFPPNVEALTLHALARRQVVAGSEAYQRKLAARDGKVSPKDILEALELPRERYPVAYAVRDTLEAFLRSAAEVPNPAHIPPEYREAVRRRGNLPPEEYLLKATSLVWRLMQDPEDPFPLSFDGFVKMWAQAGGRIRGYGAVLVDEAQDLSPVFLQVLEAHRGQLRRVYVGDPRQQIYAWRGAVDAMARLEAPERRLTWSFRFGEELARAVRAFMRRVGSPVELHGKAPWRTEVAEGLPGDGPFTVLCRTNAGVVEAMVELSLEKGSPRGVFVVGGVEEIAWLLHDAALLREGGERKRPHPELALVESWSELEALAEEFSHPSARMLVRLARRHDLRNLAGLLHRAQARTEEEAGLVVSTLHKAKGREWDRVVLWDDFPPVWEEAVREAYRRAGLLEQMREEENALYVALTRPRRFLGLGKLPGLHQLLLGERERGPAPPPAPPGEAFPFREVEARVMARLEERLREAVGLAAELLAREVSKAVAEALREVGNPGPGQASSLPRASR